MFGLYNLDPKDGKRWQAYAERCQRQLTEQQIAPGSPGTILSDVDMLLECVGPSGIITQSRNATLPAERLPELNRKSGHPVELVLKRPLLRDYPNLSGIFILLRVMDLLQVKGNRLVVCPAALDAWRKLNGTEQYFALLEALLFQAQSSVLGAEHRHEDLRSFEMIVLFLSQLSDRWHNFDYYASVRLFGPQGELPTWSLFVQQQLGLIELRPRTCSERERKSWGGRGWLIGSARLTPWGRAVVWALLEFLKKQVDEWEAAGGSQPAPDAPQQQFKFGDEAVVLTDGASGVQDNSSDAPASSEAVEEVEQSPDESSPEPDFGTLQPVFQPYFAEWRTIYARPPRDARSGTHIFKVTLAGWRGRGQSVWRRLTVPPDISLDELAGTILDAFKFDDDHLYDFRYRDQRGKTRVYNHPYTDDGPFATEITVGQTDLAVKEEMLFTFDYGDDWQFGVRLERVETGVCRLRRPRVVEKAGRAPRQYPQSEW
jgi:Plasmid pRiA4b ORF-3-like protein